MTATALVEEKISILSVVALRPKSEEQGAPYEFLLLKRAKAPAGIWCEITGGLEAGETVWQGALRELQEETQLTPEAFYSADHSYQFYNAHVDGMVRVVVFVAFIKAGAEPILNEENERYLWLSYENALAKTEFPNGRRLLSFVHEAFIENAPSEFLKIELPKS